jgi:hypothetical protein
MGVPEPSVYRRVRIEWRVCVCVVITVVTWPLYGRTCGKPYRHEDALQPLWYLERPMGQDAVIPQVYAQPCQKIVRNDKYDY